MIKAPTRSSALRMGGIEVPAAAASRRTRPQEESRAGYGHNDDGPKVDVAKLECRGEMNADQVQAHDAHHIDRHQSQEARRDPEGAATPGRWERNHRGRKENKDIHRVAIHRGREIEPTEDVRPRNV